MLALPNQHFAKAGNYTLTLEQYMRQDQLPGLMAMGVRVAKHEEKKVAPLASGMQDDYTKAGFDPHEQLLAGPKHASGYSFYCFWQGSGLLNARGLHPRRWGLFCRL